MKEFLSSCFNWYNRIFTEWFAFIGQITVCYFIHKVIIYYIDSKGYKLNKVAKNVLALFIIILVFFPSIEWWGVEQ